MNTYLSNIVKYKLFLLVIISSTSINFMNSIFNAVIVCFINNARQIFFFKMKNMISTIHLILLNLRRIKYSIEKGNNNSNFLIYQKYNLLLN